MLLGTFHVKFLIVDRKVVLINSCNIQDRPNLEMMTHLEGPVVNSFYDVALHCWHNKLEPPLPNISKPYEPPRDAAGNVRYLFRDYNPYFRDIEVLKAARAARKLLRRQTEQIDEENIELNAHPTRDRFVEAVRQAMAGPRQSFAHNKEEIAKSFAHNKEEIAHRSATAMKEMRAFGERMGMNFERFGSRPGSRRTSATDLTMLRRDDDFDDETAAHTAANRLITKPAPSDAPTSPTLNEFPMKSHTAPAPDSHPHDHHDDDDQTTTVNSSRRQSFHSAHDGLSHDGHGAPMIADYNEPILNGRMVESPVNEMREREEVLAPAPNGSPAVSKPHPLDASPVMRHVSPFDDQESSTVNHEPTINGTSTPRRRSFHWADDIPSGAQSPLYMPKVSMDEEIPPGRGTKRMFKLAKRFSKHCPKSLRSPQMLVLSARHGLLLRIRTSWTPSVLTSSMLPTIPSRSPWSVGALTVYQATMTLPIPRMRLGSRGADMPSARCSSRPLLSTPGLLFVL